MSSSWLVVQGCFAAVAWSFSAHALYRAARAAGTTGPALAAALRALVERGSVETDLPRLGAALGGPAQALLDGPATEHDAELWALRAQRAYELELTPVRGLRGLATMGTTLGLLAAVATLRAGLEVDDAGAMRAVATAAFDSAVLGFVTALPCWSALASSRMQDRRTWQGLDRAVMALAGGGRGDATRPEQGSPDDDAGEGEADTGAAT